MQKVFIIEDDALLLRMLERVFIFEHFEVEKASDGADALAKLLMADVTPCAIILDIMIPVLGGMEVLKQIKDSERLKGIPVIVLSNLSPGRENDQKILALGAAMHLLKDQYTPAEVVQKVRDVITAVV